MNVESYIKALLLELRKADKETRVLIADELRAHGYSGPETKKSKPSAPVEASE